MDVRVQDVHGDIGAKLQRQRELYRDIVATCVSIRGCDAVTFWGITDAHSWVDRSMDQPLLFDQQYRAKPAFWGVEDALLGRAR
jgi:endo-1,4-beta-xylanase